MHWVVKSTLQKVLASLPGESGEWINRELPALLGRRGGDPSARAVPVAELHAGPVLRLGLPPGNRAVLELGTGYNLYLALPFALMGYQVTTIDLHRDLSLERTRALATGLAHRVDTLAAHPAARRAADAMRADLRSALAAPSLEAFLAAVGVEYLAPYDMERFAARNAGRFGYVVSHCVFEHVPPALFPPLLRLLRQVSAPGALYSHQVDMRDHRSAEGFLVDPRLSYLDYLRYSERAWRFWNGNALAYTNRWRRRDYRAALEAAGFSVLESLDVTHDEPELPLPREALHPDFRGYPEVELRVKASLLSGRPLASDGA